MNELLIVVINWKREDETLKCLMSLHKKKHNIKILLIDNESSYKSRSFFKNVNNLYDHFKYNINNTGFSGACNIGIKFADEKSFKKILFLNTDADINNDTISLLKDELNNNNVALVSPALYDINTKNPYFYGIIPDIDNSSLLPLDIKSFETNDTNKLLLHGTVLMGNVSKLVEVNGFDERFFAYWEDVDICYRLVSKGYDCICLTEAKAFHPSQRNLEGNTIRSGYFYYYMSRNEILFWKTHTTGLVRMRAIYWQIMRSYKLIKGLIGMKYYKEIKSIIYGYIHGIFGLTGNISRL